MKGIWVATILVLPVIGLGQAESYVGTYEAVRFEKGLLIKNKTLPTDQIMVLQLSKGGKLRFGNYLSGFTGTWKVQSNLLEMTFVNSPTGKLKSPEALSVQPMPDRKRMIILSPQKYANAFEFYWNPKVIAFIKSRLETEKRRKSTGPL